MTTSFDDNPFFRGPKVAANLDDLSMIDRQLCQPLALQSPAPTDPAERAHEVAAVAAAALNRADRATMDLQILEADVAWIGQLPNSYPASNAQLDWMLTASPLSQFEQDLIKSAIANNGGLDKLSALCAKPDFNAARSDLDTYVREVKKGAQNQVLGETLTLGSSRPTSALAVAEAGVLTNQSDMLLSGARAYASYLTLAGAT